MLRVQTPGGSANDNNKNKNKKKKKKNGEAAVVPLAPPLEALQRSEWREGFDVKKLPIFGRLMSKAIDTSGFILPSRTPIIRGPRRSCTLLRVLPEDIVMALKNKAREEETTITGALYGAMALTIAEQWGTPDKPSKVVIQQAVDLNRRLTKPGGAHPIGCFVDGFTSSDTIPPEFNPGSRLWKLARKSQRYLRGCLDEEQWQDNMEEIQILLELSKYVNIGTIVEGTKDLPPKGRSASALLSNMGVVSMATDGNGYGLGTDDDETDVVTPADPRDRLNILRYHLGEAQATSGFGIMLHSATVQEQGTLCLTFSYADPIITEPEAEEFAARFEHVLKLACRAKGSARRQALT